MNATRLTKHDVRTLVKSTPGMYGSIYLAVGRNGADLLQGPIYLKNAAAAIEDRLITRGYRTTDARAFVAPLHVLVKDHAFWESQRGGLALFVSSHGLQAFRLRSEPSNEWWLGEHYRVLPLLAPKAVDLHFHLLAASANEATLYEGSSDGLQPVAVNGLPQGVEEALNLDQSTALVQVINMPHGATFHGQGPEIDRRKEELLAYLRLIDRAIHPYLAESREPLLFAGVAYLFPLFRQVNTFPYLCETCLPGNPERMGKLELRLRAVELLEHFDRRSCATDMARFEDAVGSHRTSEKLRAVLAEAHRGTIDTLFLAAGKTAWGRFDAADDALTFTDVEDPIGCDLYDLAAFQTLAHGGRVHVVPATEVPHGHVVAALLRYSTSTTATGVA